jgi:hypothetical protein
MKKEMLNIPGHKGNATQSTLIFHITPVRIAIIKNTNNKECWQGCGGKEPIYTVDVNVN